MPDDDDDLILADAIPDPEVDSDCPCDIESCGKPAEISIGDRGDLELCSDHAARLVLQALDIIDVQEALAKGGKAVLVLDRVDLDMFRSMLYRTPDGIPGTPATRERWLDWTEGRLSALSPGRS